jgi:DNA-binding SARP family transcriptional activator/Tol biopolymer transport system component
MIDFRTLGTLKLRRRDGPELDSLLAQPKRIALLAYLCLATPHGFHRRDTILGLFWPDSDESHARASLRRALHVLRHSLGEAAFHSRGDEEIAPNFDVIWCDAVAMEEKLAANQVVEALELYRGDLLPGFFLHEVPMFEHWLEDERNRLRAIAAGAACLAAETSESNKDLTEAVRWARRAAELTENDERAVRRLIELLERVGDRAGALHVYDEFVGRLASEFDAEPSAETQLLADRLRSVRGSSKKLADPADSVIPSGPIGMTAPYVSKSWWQRRPIRLASAAVGVLAISVVALASLDETPTSTTMPVTERRKLTFTGMATQGALSPDGQFLAYVVQEVDSSRLVVQDLTGGPPDTVVAFTKGTVDHYVEWSPDGARLLVRVRRGALMIHRSGGQQDSVRSFRPGDRVNWLPDSRLSLFNLQTGRLLIVNQVTGDSSRIRIPAYQTATRDGSWSPDGRAFTTITDSPDSARWAIRSITLDGRVQVVVDDSVVLNSPRWSPSGDNLYYLRGDNAIWRVNVSTRTGRPTSAPQLVQTGIDALSSATGIAHFSLSRDGRLLAYVKGEHYSNIYHVEPVDSNTPPRMERLTTGTALRWSPVVSPDGQWIAFAAQTKDGSEVFRMPLAGGRAIQITAGAKVWPRSEIAWSPDGEYLAFQSVRASSSQVWVAGVFSGELRRLHRTNTSIRTGHLAWAPGSRIAYKIPRTFIRLLDPATGADEFLVRDTADAWFHFPRYSPNGEEIAMARYHEPELTLISILRVADRAERRLPTGPLFPRGWSADGRFIYAQVPARPILVRVDALGKKPPEAVFTAPVRDMECITGPARPRQSFICAMFDFTSDIWIIENFDRR